MISQSKQKGFTIVELLIVIVVIGILAAISIVAYNGVTQKARDDQRISDARNIINAAASYQSEKGTWPATATDLTGYDTIKLSGTASTRLNAGSGALSNSNKDTRYIYAACGTTGANVWVWIEKPEDGVAKAVQYATGSGCSTTAPTS